MLCNATPAISVRTTDLRRLAHGWLLDCRYRNLSPATVELRRRGVEKFLGWLEAQGLEQVGPLEIKGFMAYLRTAHEEPEGRFGNLQLRQPLSARSLKDRHVNLSTLFRLLETEGSSDASPMDGLKPLIHRPDQVQPYRWARIPTRF